ncbi:hypothetical protein [Nitratireductor sp. OM-1]|uniref:hypothetical protein n=1 Tax=Nitratireductor sp. OM-1 TaxID=1756988 RepID=UPI000DE15AAD|nr:hypothetical protein [Nitratireductor sp. OM-1]
MPIEPLKKKAFSGTSNIFNGFLEKKLNEIITAVNGGGGGGGPASVAWGDVTDKPVVIAAGADAAAARLAIEAGTSDLTAADAVAAVAAKTEVAALAPIADPGTATATEVATAYNALVAALKA